MWRRRAKGVENVKFGLEPWCRYLAEAGTFAIVPPDIPDPASFLAENGLAVIGTPDDAIRHIERIYRIGEFGAHLILANDWADWAQTKRSYELIARYVMPHFNNGFATRRAVYDFNLQHRVEQVAALEEGIRAPTNSIRSTASSAIRFRRSKPNRKTARKNSPHRNSIRRLTVSCSHAKELSTSEGAKMKAAVFRGPNQPFTIEQVEIDDPQDHEVVVRIVASGVCHSDLHVIEGLWPSRFRRSSGHEGAGIVEKVGKAVAYVKPGDHVISSPTAFCGYCRGLHVRRSASVLQQGRHPARQGWPAAASECRAAKT